MTHARSPWPVQGACTIATLAISRHLPVQWSGLLISVRHPLAIGERQVNLDWPASWPHHADRAAFTLAKVSYDVAC